MFSTARPKVTIVREYDTKNIDIHQKPAPKRQNTTEEVTVEYTDEVTQEPLTNEAKSSSSFSSSSSSSASNTTGTTTGPVRTSSKEIDIPLSNVHPNNEGLYAVKTINKKPMKIKIQKGYSNSPNNKAVAIYGHPGSNSVQDDMEREAGRRKMEWEKEVVKMQKEFFKLSPNVMSMGSGTVATPGSIPTALGTEIIDINNTRNIYETKPDGSKVYKLRFNVRGFKPEELSVRIEGRTLRVTAKHHEEGDLGEKASKNFDRKMDLPDGVDADLLSSELSSDGILCVEAPANDVEEDPMVYNFKEEDDVRDRQQARWGQKQLQDAGENHREQRDITESGSFTIGEPFNAVSLKGEDRIMTPRIVAIPSATQRRRIDDDDDLEYEWQQHLQQQWEQQNKQPLHQYHRHRELFQDSPSNHRIQSPSRSSSSLSRIHRTPPTESYTPTSSYVEKREVFTPSSHDHHVTLPSGFTPGKEETEAVYHKGGFITGPASAFANAALNQINHQTDGSPNAFVKDNDPFNSLDSQFAPMFQSSTKTSKRGASHIEQVNQNASKLKLKVDVGSEYLPQDVQVVVDDRYIHVKAKHEQVTPTGRTARREYNRTFDAPEDLDLDTLQAVIGPDGRLIVGANLTTNRDKYAALDSIQEDMPPDGTHVEVLY